MHARKSLEVSLVGAIVAGFRAFLSARSPVFKMSTGIVIALPDVMIRLAIGDAMSCCGVVTGL